jgi:nucleotide-binding universal stress UspA family protein
MPDLTHLQECPLNQEERGVPISNIRTILVGAWPYRDNYGIAALNVALSLASQAGAEVNALMLAGKLSAPFSLLPGLTSGLIHAENQRSHDAAKAFAKSADELIRRAGLKGHAETAQDAYAYLGKLFESRARLADITVIEADSDHMVIDNGIMELALFHSGRPVLIVPGTAETFRAKKIAIAWDGGARAARAVADALPFLKQADRVEVLCVVEPAKPTTANRGAGMAEFLKKHDIAAEIVDLPLQDDAGQTITRYLVLSQTDMLVMGAYAHNRLRQFVLGGVTSAVLSKPAVVTLMSH